MNRSWTLVAGAVLAALLLSACSFVGRIFTKIRFPRRIDATCVVEAVREDPAVLDARVVGDDIWVELRRPAIQCAEDRHADVQVRLTHWYYGRTTARVEVSFPGHEPRGLEREEWRWLVARLRYRIAEHCGIDPLPAQAP